MTTVFRKIFTHTKTNKVKPDDNHIDAAEKVVTTTKEDEQNNFIRNNFVSNYTEETYTIGDSTISSDDTNAYYLFNTWYPTYNYTTSYHTELEKNDSMASFKLYHVFIINPTTLNPTTRDSTSELKLDFTYNLMKSLKLNHTNKNRTLDSIDVTNLSDESIKILNIINDYDNMIELKKMRNNTIPVADITYNDVEQQKLADIRDLIVNGKILLRASAKVISTKKCIYYMESHPTDENKGGKHTSRRTSRRARKSKKSIRKSKLRRRHRK